MDEKVEFRRVIEDILSGVISSRQEFEVVKRGLAQRLGLDKFPRNSEFLRYAKDAEKKNLLAILQKKPSKTLSGVAVVACMTMPQACPHGKCKYCPGGPDLDVPQSYTGKEPAARRAIQYGFNPFLQTTFRLKQLFDIGHPVDKVELIVMGGTLTAQTFDYQDWFVKSCFIAMNDFSRNRLLIDEVGEEKFIRDYEAAVPRFQYTQDVQKKNMSSDVRCVGVTFEPRPDWCKKEQIDFMLGFGVTRVEIGVQNPDDELYEKIERGHTVADVVDATADCKNSALKVGYHMMPGLRGYDPDYDLQAFDLIFSDSRFMPDMLKIYPLIVMPGTEFYDNWMAGDFTPITTDEAVKVISDVKGMLPKWVRTMRVMRDIPSNLVAAGIKSSNLGQLVSERMRREKIVCKCIRCREVGQKLKFGVEPEPGNIKLCRTDYDASGGKEVFLSFEDELNDVLIGFTRLRIPSESFRPEITDSTSLIRELHVYGPMVEVGEKPVFEWQHRGYGKELLAEAERISREEFDMDKLAVISGVGVRNYYGMQGYALDGVYMSKGI